MYISWNGADVTINGVDYNALATDEDACVDLAGCNSVSWTAILLIIQIMVNWRSFQGYDCDGAAVYGNYL